MRPSYCAAFLCHWSLFKGADKGAPLVAKARKGAFFGPSFPTFLFTKVVPASGLELSEESGRNCGFQRKRAFLYSSFPPTPVLSSLSSAVRRKRVFLPTLPGRLEVGAGRRRGLAGKGITATVSAIHAKHGSGREKNWRKNLIFSDLIEKHFHKCQPLPITSKAFGYKMDRICPFECCICVFTFICAFVIVCICHHLNCHRHFADPSLSASVAQPKANSRLDRRLLPPHRLEDHPHSQTYS